MVQRANGGGREKVERELARQYLGFMVIKPLPGSPIGRTVLRTFDRDVPGGQRREFTAIRRYTVSLAGLSLSVRGLAFQQQDQGVSACATTALWSALQRTAPLEHLSSPTPAQITEAASRYMLLGGRALPSEGLHFDQLCEAVRATGLAPVLLTSISPREDRAHMATYLRSGLPVLLGIRPMGKAKLTPCVWSVFVGERSSLQRIPRSAIGTARRRLSVSMSMMTGSVHTRQRP